ncbi:ammonium transporter [Reichenbachiella ulvae]|uniref:Ammonium transporter n=1 Tax=Reichenbachiella ulvae TaxID=2980104 RepID=A0ABT3CTZ1_9BACT|nr:ammonium transporter [Reichenbachiella ulvae]MCV9387171.1 ammonium transporter [Reichenbachiella ulvae]
MKRKIVVTTLLLGWATVSVAADTPDPTFSFPINIDHVWVLLSAALVFFMQAGFKAFEVGMVRHEHGNAVAIKNIIDWIIGSLIFLFLGFGVMFGKSSYGIIGTDLFFGMGIQDNPDGSPLGSIFFLFQIAFATTALTIVSGAMSERTGFIPYMTASALVALLIYPVFGHWAWGNLFYADNPAWLADLGFIDFAGSTVVHSIGAWVALVGIWKIGPRLGRFDENGNPVAFKASSYAYSVMGLLILWLGWWGFNGGSQLALDGAVGEIILNTNIAGAAAGLVAFFHCYWFQKREDLYPKFLGGIIGGLVAITACCSMVSHLGALAVGLTAGLIHNYAYDLILYKCKLDDPVGAIPVHGFCGVWGTLCVALFGQLSPETSRLTQFGIQLLGCGVAFGFTTIVSYVMFSVLEKTVGLRVSPEEEKTGIIIGGEVAAEEEEEIGMSEAELLELMK